MNKTALATALGLTFGGASLASNAALTASSVLAFTPGAFGCVVGGTYPNNCLYGIIDVTGGSYFTMDANGNGKVDIGEKTPFQSAGSYGGVHLGSVDTATGSHSGTINGTESPVYDIWQFFGNTGLDYTTKAITVVTDSGATKTLDFSGWTVTWNGIALIPMGGDPTNFGAADTGLATITCSASTCSVTSAFTLSYAAHVPLGDPSGFGGVPYTISMVGHVGESAVPIPAAAWLFGSGLVGLAAVARRKKKA